MTPDSIRDLTEGLPPILTPAKVAEFLDLNERTVRNWAADEKFSGALRTCPGKKGWWRIPRSGPREFPARTGAGI